MKTILKLTLALTLLGTAAYGQVPGYAERFAAHYGYSPFEAAPQPAPVQAPVVVYSQAGNTLFTSAGPMLGDSLGGEVIQPTGKDILFNLAIPCIREMGRDPPSQLKEFLPRQLLDGLFDFGQRAHVLFVTRGSDPGKLDSGLAPHLAGGVSGYG